MPTYVCSAAAGRLTPAQKLKSSALSPLSIMRRLALHDIWSKSSSATLRQTVTTWPANWRQRIRSGSVAIFEADGLTSRKAKCSGG
jgi:hypothetical protein